MFTLNTTIDTVHGAQKEAIKTFVKNEAIAKQLGTFVDAQAAYTKDAFKVGTETATRIGEEVFKASRQAVENMSNSEFVKKYADKVSQDFYSTFWREAFKGYTSQTATKAAEKAE